MSLRPAFLSFFFLFLPSVGDWLTNHGGIWRFPPSIFSGWLWPIRAGGVGEKVGYTLEVHPRVKEGSNGSHGGSRWDARDYFSFCYLWFTFSLTPSRFSRNFRAVWTFSASRIILSFFPLRKTLTSHSRGNVRYCIPGR